MFYSVFLLFQVRSEVQKQLQLTATWRMRQDVQQEVSMCSYGVKISNKFIYYGSLENKIFGTDKTNCVDFIILCINFRSVWV
jgi:hypothetical protein